MATAEATETYLTPTEIAHELRLDPSAPVRWLKKGVLLSDNVRLQLQHLCTPGGYRIKRAWLDAFLAAIADDRANKPKVERKPPAKSPRVAKMNAELQAAGLI